MAQKLSKILQSISGRFQEEKIPCALIGAHALAAYGLMRYTADLDFLSEKRYHPKIRTLLMKLGYTPYHETEMFAQFDSEMGVLGSIDFMFVSTPEGLEMLERRVGVFDETMGRYFVIQPTDYIIFKLMAIANNPERLQRDEADILGVLKGAFQEQIPEDFEPLQEERLMRMADRFGQTRRMERLIRDAARQPKEMGRFFL